MAGNLVCAGAQLMCSFGMAPSALVVTPQNKVLCGGPPAANIMDMKPMANIVPFGMCSSMANPTVASATAAAMGVLTPMPCVPVISGPWAPGSTTVLCCFSWQLLARVPMEGHDVRLPLVATEHGVLKAAAFQGGL